MSWLADDVFTLYAKQQPRRKVGVLIEDFLGKPWWATVEIDANDCLVAPKNADERVLLPAKNTEGFTVLRAPPYRDCGNALELAGGFYKPPPPFLFKS